MSALRVPGFDAVELLGYGSGGEVWLARDRATGTPVALKRLRADADLAARDRLRREAAVLAGVDHPHVVRLRAVVADGDAMVLVLDLAPGGSLARLLATRRRLGTGEVVTLGVPLAQALAAVHAQGLLHGDVTPANVLFGADGRPLLSDLGVARLLGAAGGAVHGTRGYLDPAVALRAAPTRGSDVHGLAATCLAALTGTAPYDDTGTRVPLPADLDGPAARLAAVLEEALARDPGDRPTAEALAAAVFDAAPAEPVRLDRAAPQAITGPVTGSAVAAATHQVDPARRPVPDVSAEPAGPERFRVVQAAARAVRTASRGAFATVATGAAVLLAVVAGFAWAGADSETSAAGVPARPTTTRAVAPSAAATPAPRQPAVAVATGRWSSTLARLDRSRSSAFAAGDPGRLASVYAAHAPALTRDRRVLAELTDSGLRADGLRLTATHVAVQGRTGERVRLAVTDVMPAYRLVDIGGTVVAQRPGRGERTWTVVLARAGGVWKVYDVVRG